MLSEKQHKYKNQPDHPNSRMESWGSTLKSMSLLSQTLTLLGFSLIIIQPIAETTSDYSTLVYKNCTSKLVTGSTKSHSESLHSFFEDLISKSSREKFYKTTAGDENNGISGLFQCRGDLSSYDYYKCMTSLPEMSDSSCDKSVSARIQLHGCYVRYEANEFIEERSKFELLHKICDKKKAAALGFEKARDAAFAAVERGVIDGDGYCKESCELMQVITQCDRWHFRLLKKSAAAHFQGKFIWTVVLLAMVTTQMEYRIT